MAKILSVVSKAGLARIVDPVAGALLRAGVSPNMVTVAGTVGVLIGALGFGARGQLLLGVVIVTVSALTDMIDGAMARQRGIASKFGAVLDSTMDRIADGAIFGAVAFWLATQDEFRASAAALLCLIAGAVVSYVKARAEGVGLTCNVGIAERTERLLLIGAGALLQHFWNVGLEAALWLLALLSLITVWQRMWHVYREAKARSAAEGRPA